MFIKARAETLYDFVKRDTTRNYFICYTLNHQSPYQDAWTYSEDHEIKVAVFLRKTGNIQVAYQENFDLNCCKNHMENLLMSIDWKQAIVHTEVMQLISDMCFETTIRPGAWIARCTPESWHSKKVILESSYQLSELSSADMDEIVSIYRDVFEHFAADLYMTEKLNCRRGRAIGVKWNNQLVSVAQTDYESDSSALIVGVATKKDFQGKSIGRVCFQSLCETLIHEGKTLFLQYDSPIAGKLYQSTGFENYERVYHITNNENKS